MANSPQKVLHPTLFFSNNLCTIRQQLKDDLSISYINNKKEKNQIKLKEMQTTNLWVPQVFSLLISSYPFHSKTYPLFSRFKEDVHEFSLNHS